MNWGRKCSQNQVVDTLAIRSANDKRKKERKKKNQTKTNNLDLVCWAVGNILQRL